MATTVAAQPHLFWQAMAGVPAEQQREQQEHEDREPAPDPPVFDEPQPSSVAPARQFLPRPPSAAAHAVAAASVAPTALARLFAVLLHQLLDGTASLAARLPMPRGGQGGGSAAAPGNHANRSGGSPVSAPLAPTPAVVAAAAPRSASPAVLGLAPGEIESEEEEEEGDGLTAAELRRLQASTAFQRHIRCSWPGGFAARRAMRRGVARSCAAAVALLLLLLLLRADRLLR